MAQIHLRRSRTMLPRNKNPAVATLCLCCCILIVFSIISVFFTSIVAKCQGAKFEVDIVVFNSTETEDEDSQNGANNTRKQPPIEAEVDEMWSYYHDKSHQDWLWWAVDHKTNTPLAFTFGTREPCNLDILLGHLSRFNIVKFYTDNNFAYINHIPDENHEIGKRNTQNIERDHLTFRTRIKSLPGKQFAFPK